MPTNTPSVDPKPLTLTTANYWSELESLLRGGELPLELVDSLKALVSSHMSRTNPPTASRLAIKQAIEHFSARNVLLVNSAGEELLELTLFIPAPENKETRRMFFRFIPKYPGGSLIQLRLIEVLNLID